MQTTPSPQNITTKIILTVILLLIDLIFNSFVEINFSTSSTQLTPYYVNFYVIPIQMFVTFLIVIMIIVLMWQTFPLRYGLIGSLLRQFKWTFLSIILFIGLTAAQRGIRLHAVIIQQNLWSQLNLWNNIAYRILYYLRYLTYPIFYGLIINFCMKIIEPSFYKPHRWLK